VSQTPLFDLDSSDADRRRVEEALLQAVQTPDAYLTEIASHLLLAGGKRLRPMFSVVASQVAGAPTTEDAVQGGISCELVHLGSLYHDDVMDESPTRRGVETVNAKWGNLQAILAGDFLLARASEIAASLGTRRRNAAKKRHIARRHHRGGLGRADGVRRFQAASGQGGCGGHQALEGIGRIVQAAVA